MNAVLNKLSPSVTNHIRMDHTHVLTTFHRYKDDTSPSVKKALVDTICMAVEIHAQLEEEIFYPAMRAVDPGIVDKSFPEHDEMRQMIAGLRNMEPGDPQYDRTFMALMRNIMHHVADEETTLLPEAERVLGDRVNELGAEWAKRKMQLAMPRAGELAMNTVKAMPASTMLLGAGALLAGSYIIGHAFKKHD
jgi:hemerythrin-like domain-containing protein